MSNPSIEVYFTQEFLDYLATSFGTIASKVFLLSNDDGLVVTEDIVLVPSDVSLEKKAEGVVTIEREEDRYLVDNVIQYSATIKNLNPRQKNKSIVMTGTLTELIWGTNTGEINDLSHWDLESASELLQGSSANIYENMTGPSIWGTTVNPSWGSDVNFSYSTEPSLYYSSDQALFIKENPTERLTKEIFSRVFNSSCDYILHRWSGNPTLREQNYGTFTYRYWDSYNIHWTQMTMPDMFPVFTGSSASNASSFVPGTIPVLLSYSGVQSVFGYDESNQLISSGSASTLTSFMYQSETGLMLGTFSELVFEATSTQTIDGFFLTNESIRVKHAQAEIFDLPEDLPLVIFGCRINGYQGLNMTHKSGLNPAGGHNCTIVKTPKISLAMDVIII